jgi:hypothetical protein
MWWSVFRRQLILAGAVGMSIVSPRASAQAPGGKQAADSRAQLIARAHVADSLGRREEAFLVRSRLRDGDFDVGDVIIASYEGPQPLGLNRRDSLVVGAGKMIQLLSPLGDMDLHGILRSEISDSITQRVAKYYKNEVVHVMPLIRLSISGATKTGFYHFRPDEPLTDVIMRAGGQGAGGDLHSVTIKRGAQTIWTAADVQTAFSEGLTVEQLDLEAGDEVALGDSTATSKAAWMYALQIGTSLVTAFVIQYLVRRR